VPTHSCAVERAQVCRENILKFQKMCFLGIFRKFQIFNEKAEVKRSKLKKD